MKVYRYVLALLTLAVLIVPQATPVQSAPLSAEITINLQPGDTVTINCPTRLIPKSASYTRVMLLCRPTDATAKDTVASTVVADATATTIATADATVTTTATTVATADATVTTTATTVAIVDATVTSAASADATAASKAAAVATATATQLLAPTASQHVADLNPSDVLTINCSTRLMPKSASKTKVKLLCRPVAAIATATATRPAEPTVTQPSVPTATKMSMATATPASAPTAVDQSTPTATEMSMPTATQQSAPTATKGAGGLTQPYANAPACPSHSSNAWHGIWDYQRGCHYDHTHGDDPSLANSYFGTFGALWGGSTISYPFNSGPMENTMKHGGYKISVRMPGYHPFPKCGTEDNTDITGDHSDNCVVAARVEYHVVGGLMDIIVRTHSFFAEMYVCSGASNYTQCGIVRTGGLVDYGQLQAPHYNARIVRPGGTIDFGDGMTMTYSADGPELPSRSGEPYVFSIPYSAEDLASFRRNSPREPGANNSYSFKATIDQWSTNDWDCELKDPDGTCHNLYTHFLFQVGDAWNLVDAQNLNNVHWICKGEPGCEYDGSLIGMNEIAVRVLQAWQPNGNGFVTFKGYTDKWGNPKTGCTSVSADCVPFVLEHAPVGVAASRSDNLCECEVYEYDVYFKGKPSGWIKHPN